MARMARPSFAGQREDEACSLAINVAWFDG